MAQQSHEVNSSERLGDERPTNLPMPPDFRGFSRSFEQITFGKSHEDWIQRAGLQPRIAADVISVYPVFRGLKKRVQNLEGLWRQAQFHLANLHM
jgi:hypothetical protein